MKPEREEGIDNVRKLFTKQKYSDDHDDKGVEPEENIMGYVLPIT